MYVTNKSWVIRLFSCLAVQVIASLHVHVIALVQLLVHLLVHCWCFIAGMIIPQNPAIISTFIISTERL